MKRIRLERKPPRPRAASEPEPVLEPVSVGDQPRRRGKVKATSPKPRQREFRYQPRHYQPGIRKVEMRVLLRGCLEEAEQGDSVSKLYALLLAKSLLERDPQLQWVVGKVGLAMMEADEG